MLDRDKSKTHTALLPGYGDNILICFKYFLHELMKHSSFHRALKSTDRVSFFKPFNSVLTLYSSTSSKLFFLKVIQSRGNSVKLRGNSKLSYLLLRNLS